MHESRLSRLRFVLLCCQSILLPLSAALAQSPGLPSSPKSSILILYNSSDEYGARCFHETLISLRYARIPYRSLDLSKASSLPLLNQFSSVLITTEMIWKLPAASCEQLENFVSHGGGLAVLYRGWNPNLGGLFGIQNRNAPEIDTARSRGLVFTGEFLPGTKGLSINDVLLADISSLAVDLDSGDVVFATTWIGNYPVAWLRRFGEGTVIYWNTSLLTEKIYRGFIIGTIGCVQPWTAALIMDISTVCLDDFPLPASNQKPEPIRSEFDETSVQFYYLRWYPDMMELSKTFGLKFTTAIIFNYAEMTSPPYTFTEWSRSVIEVAGKPINAAVWATRRVSRENEMAFHGHNHLPLTIKNWGNEANMELALTAAKRQWEMDNLGPEPTSYIPPMNVIDSVGMNALLNVFPNIRVVAGQYLGKFELGQAREFGQDPWKNTLTDVPRMTSGFVMDDFNKLETISMIHSLGAWNHFVHPDDVIPTPGRYQENVREDENLDVVGWYHKPKNDGLFYRFRTWLQFVKEYFPWLRSLTLSGARDIVLKYAASASTVVSLGNQVRFSATKAPAFYMFYLPGNNRILSVNGGTIIHDERMEFSKYYVLESSNGEMVATLKDSVASMDFQGPEQGDLYHTRGLARNDVLIPETLAETSAAVAAQSDLRQADAFIAAGKQRDAINLLEQSSRRRPNDVGIWSKLRQLYDWNNKPDKALKACETVVRLDPSDLAAMKILAQRYVWVNRQDDAVRMYEKILRREPKNITVLKTLAELCVGSSRQQEAIPLYERILRQEPKNVKLRKTLADLYFWNSKNERGIGEYQRILKIDKADTAVIRLLAEKYLEMDRQADALRLYEHLLAHRSDDVELRKRLAQVYTWNNEGQKAVEQYEAILAINGTDSQTKKTLARMYVENNNLDKAIVQLKEILQEDPKDITSLKRLGELYLWRERQKEALPLYEKIVAAEPDSLSYRLMLGRLYAWTKNPVAAKKQFAEVVKRDRSSIEALSQLADIERSEGEWKLAMSHYEQVLSVDAQNKEARSAVEDIRREHGLLFRTSYERIEDSNDLTREQVPLAAGLLQAGDWQLGIHAVRQSIRDRRLNESGQGYGIGFDGLYTLNQDMSLSTVLLATSYTSGWIPVSLVLQVNGTLTPRLYSAVKLKRSETTEGVQAVKSKIFLNSAGGELYFQTTNRLSFSGSAEADFYSDDNTKLTLASFSTYKLMLGNPTIALLANYAYQDSKVIYPSSVPYWTPSKLSTTSFGIDVTAGLFESVSIEAAYLNTLQAGVFSSNVRAQISLHPSAFSEVLIYYEKLGSKVYSQNTLRAIIQYRY